MRKWLTGFWMLLAALCLLAPEALVRDSYEEQHREAVNGPPGWRFPLGTDDLGRDRFVRLIYAARVSIGCAALASLLAVSLAVSLGTIAGMLGGVWDRLFSYSTEIAISLPQLFLLICVRASLPLDAGALSLTVVTYLALTSLGWAAPARLVRDVVRKLRREEFLLQAECLGCPPSRIWRVQIAPNLKSLALAQFWTSIPIFLLGEANLGLLGLGVAEPIPSLGGLMREAEGYGRIQSQPWLLAPILLVILLSLGVWRLGNREERIRG